MSQRWLKWLLEPTQEDVSALRSVLRGAPDMAVIARLARYEWNASGLRLLARAVRAILSDPQQSAAAFDLGYSRVKILMFSHASSQFLIETIIGSGVRNQLLIDVQVVEYEEPESYLAREGAAVRTFDPDLVLLNFDVNAFNLSATLGSEQAAQSTIDFAMNRLARIREAIGTAIGKAVIVQTVNPDPAQSRLSLDRRLIGSHADMVRRLNAAIAVKAQKDGDLLLDVAGLAEQVGLDHWVSRKYWATAKYPFSPDAAALYAYHVCNLAAVLIGKSRRVLVLDLDNTLWGGIVGDDGKDNLLLGSGSAAGESHQDIQRMAKSLQERGVVLCVSSKNEEDIALDAFRNHPEMILKEDDIAVFQINWTDKAANIKALAEKLGLGLNSFVFLDDNPAERARVREALYEVAVPELPKDVSEWLPVFQSACYFEAVTFSKEDAQRFEYYRSNAKRDEEIEKFADHDAFLASLKMQMTIQPFDPAGRTRIAQLIAKSNQFNLTTKRRSESEVAQLETQPDWLTYQVRLSDKFGDNGMICVIIALIGGQTLEIDTWLMSCRVLGRRIEERLLDELVLAAHSKGIETIIGHYIPTTKNAMVRDHYAKLGFSKRSANPDGTSTWSLDVPKYQPKKTAIEIIK
jgi:FkbH-like protein